MTQTTKSTTTILQNIIYNTIKVPHRYTVQGSDTTMFSAAPSARTTKTAAVT